MRTLSVALSIAAVGIGFIGCQTASALPLDAAAIRQSAAAVSDVEKSQYSERHTKHGFVKCYREFVFGKYSCHTY